MLDCKLTCWWSGSLLFRDWNSHIKARWLHRGRGRPYRMHYAYHAPCSPWHVRNGQKTGQKLFHVTSSGQYECSEPCINTVDFNSLWTAWARAYAHAAAHDREGAIFKYYENFEFKSYWNAVSWARSQKSLLTRYWLESCIAATRHGNAVQRYSQKVAKLQPADSGDVAPRKQCSRLHARKLDEHHELLIIAIVMENPWVYLREVYQRIEEATHTRVSGSAVCRILRKNGYTRKKIQQEASVEYKAAFMAQVLQYNPEDLVWVDELDSDAKSHIRKFGYALRGRTPIYHRCLAWGKRISAIAAISREGLVGVELATGNVNAEKFLEFVQGTLIPEMKPFDGTKRKSIVVLDNCSIHHARLVTDALKDAGILVIYLPPYSHDLNPIKEAFSYIKCYLKDHNDLLQAVTQPTSIIQAAFDSITAKQCKGWIKHSGYY